MLATARLTKRQKKGIAFRERKHGKRTDSPPGNLDGETDVPSVEDQALVDATQGQQGRQVSAKVLLGGGNAGGKPTEARRVVVAARKEKRKIDEEEAGTREPSDQPKPKRRRGSSGGTLVGMGQHVEAGEEGEGGEKAKQRFILFLGNLKYTTTSESVQAHFSACDPPPTVRLLTPKPSTRSVTKPVIKSKGCAFLEFEHRGALQQGLRLHHSQLDGRQINVELTAGGGGKGAARMKKLKERNKELQGQRRKRQEPRVEIPTEGAPRFSTTSGAEPVHTHKRTWTVGDVEEEATHRGGKKQKKKCRGRPKDIRTGVNAIPIG